MGEEPNFDRYNPLNGLYRTYIEDRWGNTFVDHGEYFAEGWRIVSADWGRLRLTDTSLPPWAEVVSRQFDLSGFLFKQLVMALLMQEEMKEAEFLSLWGDLRLIFSPALVPGDQLADNYANSHEGGELIRAIQQLYGSDQLAARKRVLNRISFGAFRNDELSWMLANQPDIVEVGGGRMYFADWYRRNGGKIVSIDNDGYGEIFQETMHPWTLNFIKSGGFVFGGVEKLAEHAKDRALLISWPGSDFPAEALEVFAANGGRIFLFKLGGFLGGISDSTHPGYVPPANPGANRIRFFRTLSRRWRQIPGPAFLPLQMANNLLVFELCS